MNPSKNGTFKNDFLASIVVFLVALPLCMGIAIACGAPVAAGLVTGIIGGIVVGSLAGCPLQVSGPAAGLIVLVHEVIREFGLETLGVVVLLAGVLQLTAGMLKLGQWFRAVSPAVIKGMLAGIGVLIFASQFHVMVDDRPQGSGIQNLLTIPRAVAKSLTFDEVPSREVRQHLTGTLRTVGELHREQEHLRHLTAEMHRTPSPEIELLVNEQADVMRRLDAVAAELQSLELVPNGGRAERIRVASSAAHEHTQAAIAALQNGDLETAAEAQSAASEDLETLLGGLKNHNLAALLGLLTIAAIVLWQTMAPKRIRFIPAPLTAVILATALAFVLALPVFYVEVPTNLWEEIRFPSLAVFTETPWQMLLQHAVVIAIVASAETLLCATAVDQMHSGPRTRYDRELSAQGVGNMICGCLGALPMTGVIVRSSANVKAGAQTRLSAIMHGVWLLVFVAGLAFLLRLIPTAALAAILVFTGYKLIDIKSIKELRKYGWGEVGIYAATVITIVSVDLLTGVIVGVVLAAVKLLYTFSHLNVQLARQPDGNIAVLKLSGAATFLRLPRLASELEKAPPGAELHVDFEHLDYIDHACLDLLMTWAKQHETTGGKLVIDWDSLHASFRREKPARQPQPARQVA
ncbi:MAG: STAS domain-containing protein [Planctomycetes bacterium]|nr:STAS domain-containing protein [Planctomycetota bacterium]